LHRLPPIILSLKWRSPKASLCVTVPVTAGLWVRHIFNSEMPDLTEISVAHHLENSESHGGDGWLGGESNGGDGCCDSVATLQVLYHVCMVILLGPVQWRCAVSILGMYIGTVLIH
jgi:hypothetical protein